MPQRLHLPRALLLVLCLIPFPRQLILVSACSLKV